MFKKLAKIKYLPNSFQVIDKGDYVECAVSQKRIPLDKLNYWNVELQEPYFSYVEAFQKKEQLEQTTTIPYKNKSVYLSKVKL